MHGFSMLLIGIRSRATAPRCRRINWFDGRAGRARHTDYGDENLRAGHGTEWAGKRLPQGAEKMLSCSGGDGTILEVACALMNTDVPL